MTLIIKGENVKTFKLFFVDKNRSKLAHTPSIYAGYSPKGGY